MTRDIWELRWQLVPLLAGQPSIYSTHSSSHSICLAKIGASMYHRSRWSWLNLLTKPHVIEVFLGNSFQPNRGPCCSHCFEIFYHCWLLTFLALRLLPLHNSGGDWEEGWARCPMSLDFPFCAESDTFLTYQVCCFHLWWPLQQYQLLTWIGEWRLRWAKLKSHSHLWGGVENIPKVQV